MPRIARVKEDYAVYHIMIRGNNRDPIFFDDDDRLRFLYTLKMYIEKYKIAVYAYCLMTNHVHLIVYANGQDISKVMQGINLSYTHYINRTYERCGHLFQGRFKSIIVRNDNHLNVETKYIHNNPVRAGITENASEYKWSSMNIYLGQKDPFEIIDEEFVLKLFDSTKSRARELFLAFVNDNNKEKIRSEIEEDVYVSSDERPIIESIEIDVVLTKIAVYFGVFIDEILQRGNKRNAKERQAAVYFASLKGKLQYKEIGRKFGICASAVGHNIKKAIEYLRKNKVLSYELGLLF